MTEPTSTSAAGGIALWKLGAAILGIGVVASALGFLVLMPRTPKEAAVRVVATMIGSALFGPLLVFGAYTHLPWIFSGATALAASVGLEPWLGTLAASAPLLAMGGLPCWWIVGATLLWLDRRQGHDLGELAVAVRTDVSKVIGG